MSYGAPFQLSNHFETAPPHAIVVPTVPSPIVLDIDNVRLTKQEAMMERLEARMIQVMMHKEETFENSHGEKEKIQGKVEKQKETTRGVHFFSFFFFLFYSKESEG